MNDLSKFGRCEKCGASLTYWHVVDGQGVHDDNDGMDKYCGGRVALPQGIFPDGTSKTKENQE